MLFSYWRTDGRETHKQGGKPFAVKVLKTILLFSIMVVWPIALESKNTLKSALKSHIDCLS